MHGSTKSRASIDMIKLCFFSYVFLSVRLYHGCMLGTNIKQVKQRWLEFAHIYLIQWVIWLNADEAAHNPTYCLATVGAYRLIFHIKLFCIRVWEIAYKCCFRQVPHGKERKIKLLVSATKPYSGTSLGIGSMFCHHLLYHFYVLFFLFFERQCLVRRQIAIDLSTTDRICNLCIDLFW